MALGPSDFALLKAPTKAAELGLPLGLIEDLFMRRVLTERLTTIGRACEALAISHAVGDEIAEALRQKNLLEYHGVEGRDYRISLTEQGHRMTAERMQAGRHVAKMPIPLEDYQTLVELQRAEVTLSRPQAKAAYADMVLEDSLLDQIGPAFLSEGAIFFYGPPGTGKTSLAERMSRFYDDEVLVPHYISVDGQIIAVFDPSLHQASDDQPPGLDPRYTLCQRPLIMVGGELTLDMMDLQYDAMSGLNAAPIQLLANNGILVVDDFGRQSASPDQILNRWIIPLSRGIDYLRPNTGTKFTVPFELKLVISTNIDPHDLGDDAFLRRLRNKVYVGACTEAAFNWILVRAAKKYGLEVSAQSAAHLIAVTRGQLGELRPYVAVDFCELADGICAYDGVAPVLDGGLIDRVANVYFVRDVGSGPGASSDGATAPTGPQPRSAPAQAQPASSGAPTRPTVPTPPGGRPEVDRAPATAPSGPPDPQPAATPPRPGQPAGTAPAAGHPPVPPHPSA